MCILGRSVIAEFECEKYEILTTSLRYGVNEHILRTKTYSSKFAPQQSFFAKRTPFSIALTAQNRPEARKRNQTNARAHTKYWGDGHGCVP